MKKTCPTCGKSAEYALQTAGFCQFCGASLQKSGVQPLLLQAQKETDPLKKRALYERALQEEADCFEALKQLAFLGRLGETGGKPDFSRIPSWPLDCLRQPKLYNAKRRTEMMTLLMENAPYRRALAAAPDAHAFEREYLEAMAAHYVELFLKNSSQITTMFFGIRRKAADVQAQCAAAVENMRQNARELAGIPDELREKLCDALKGGLEAAFRTDP